MLTIRLYTPLNLHSTAPWQRLSFPLYTLRNWGTESSHDLPNVTELVRGEAIPLGCLTEITCAARDIQFWLEEASQPLGSIRTSSLCSLLLWTESDLCMDKRALFLKLGRLAFESQLLFYYLHAWTPLSSVSSSINRGNNDDFIESLCKLKGIRYEKSLRTSLLPSHPQKGFRTTQGLSEGCYLEHSSDWLIQLFLICFLLSHGEKVRLSLPCHLLRILTLAC